MNSEQKENWIRKAKCMYVGFETLFYVVRHLDSTASYLPTCLRLRKAKYASEREKKKERKKLIIENFVI